MQQISFKGYIPTRYFARHPKTGKFVPVLKNENIKKCNNFIVKSLNKTAKNNKGDEFVKMYKDTDKDYARNPIVSSIYDTEKPVVYLISGSDSEAIREMGRDFGRKKKEANDLPEYAIASTIKRTGREYYNQTRKFINNFCKRTKNTEGRDLTLHVFFEPKYTKKEHKLTGFEFVDAKFVDDDII